VKTKPVELLKESLTNLLEAKKWLLHSYEICRVYKQNEALEVEALDAFEALISRFARATDMLINKVYRAIDLVELEVPGALLDVINRACKRQLLDSVDELRALKDLRNSIAHEYAAPDLKALFFTTLKKTPELISLIERAENYCQRYQ
jgi:uncharacterized protein YutE (UPF0331/DUF86 family)